MIRRILFFLAIIFIIIFIYRWAAPDHFDGLITDIKSRGTNSTGDIQSDTIDATIDTTTEDQKTGSDDSSGPVSASSGSLLERLLESILGSEDEGSDTTTGDSIIPIDTGLTSDTDTTETQNNTTTPSLVDQHNNRIIEDMIREATKGLNDQDIKETAIILDNVQ